METNKIKYFMQRIDKGLFDVVDIEEEFKGLHVLSLENMNTIGKAKNVYTEGYAESDTLRVSLPKDDNYANEATVINLKVLVAGEEKNRQKTLDDFCDYVRKGKHHYRDTKRNREFDFVVKDEIKVSDEQWEGDNPYIIVEIPLQNLNGKTTLRQ